MIGELQTCIDFTYLVKGFKGNRTFKTTYENTMEAIKEFAKAYEYKNRIILILIMSIILFTKCIASEVRNIPWHITEIGFNLGYPDRLKYQEVAMQDLSRLGIQHVRIYEIFDGKPSILYQKRLKNSLDRVLRYNLIPMLSISNIPGEFLPNNFELTNIDKLPFGVKQKIARIITYSNRFPPSDIEKYKVKMNELIELLFLTYGKERVCSWWFEIGNEPDAPLYFWGSANEFDLMSQAAIDVFKANGIEQLGGFGVTQHAVIQDDNRKQSFEYNQLMAQWSKNKHKDNFLSFHIYERRDESLFPLIGLPSWIKNSNQLVMITEWNVSSCGERAVKIFETPGVWGKAFIYLLADCAVNNIDRIYLFDLMDYPLHHTLQLGAFDSKGQPKSWYFEFEAIWNVIREGYKVETKEAALLIFGKNQQQIVLATDKLLHINLSDVIYSPIRTKNSQYLEKGQWAILSNKIMSKLKKEEHTKWKN